MVHPGLLPAVDAAKQGSRALVIGIETESLVLRAPPTGGQAPFHFHAPATEANDIVVDPKKESEVGQCNRGSQILMSDAWAHQGKGGIYLKVIPET